MFINLWGVQALYALSRRTAVAAAMSSWEL
jgi:hypothetical protein